MDSMEGVDSESTESTRNGIMGTIELQHKYLDEPISDLTDKVHQLPCCIKYTGPCSVSDYFKPKKTGVEVEEGLSVDEACFRGRKLQGTAIPLPHAYTGFVLGKKKGPSKRKSTEISEDNLNQWEARAKFQSINYWNHDNLPSQSDAFLRSIHWLPVASALHKPVSPSDIALASTRFEVKMD